METPSSLVLRHLPLGRGPWKTFEPFLFCVHHCDHYPAGNQQMAPQESLAGRNIGSDFSGLNGWSMYHGNQIPIIPLMAAVCTFVGGFGPWPRVPGPGPDMAQVGPRGMFFFGIRICFI